MGATVCERTFCGEGSCTAYLSTVGPTAGLDVESYIHSKYIVIWACNSVSTNLHHWAIVQDAKKKGAKVVVIDSYKSRTAKAADWHISPKPGTDGALAMAFINSIIEFLPVSSSLPSTAANADPLIIGVLSPGNSY